MEKSGTRCPILPCIIQVGSDFLKLIMKPYSPAPSNAFSVSALNKFATQKNIRPTKSTDFKGNSIIDNFEITDEFDAAIGHIEAGQQILLITGQAGTGKSVFIQYLRSEIKKNCVVVAPTGVAALNVGGQTIHSFFHFPPKPIDLDSIQQVKNRTLYQKMDVLIIDEISMVRADMLDAIEMFLRKNAHDEKLPFGGVQVVLIGDLFQLPPVVARQEEAILFGGVYDSEFFFSAHCLKNCSLTFIEFTKVFRQSEVKFLSLLSNVREGNELPRTIDEINDRCYTDLPPRSDNFPIILTYTNLSANRTNDFMLSKIKEKEQVFEGKLVGRFTIEKEKLPAPYFLKLKPGAQVMFTKNDSGRRWVNGTIGTVEKISDDSIVVNIPNHEDYFTHTVQKETWECMKFMYDYDENKIKTEAIGAYTQFPLTLAWAVTIHKSQGLTLDNVIVDLGSGAFASGQVYVALSRCRSIDNIRLKRPLLEKDILINPIISRFYAYLRTKPIKAGASAPSGVSTFIFIKGDK
jgi:ATP-dependent exoDNAse (exonuclease V) alpha subunit